MRIKLMMAARGIVMRGLAGKASAGVMINATDKGGGDWQYECFN